MGEQLIEVPMGRGFGHQGSLYLERDMINLNLGPLVIITLN